MKKLILLLILIFLCACAKNINSNYYTLTSNTQMNTSQLDNNMKINFGIFITSVPNFTERTQIAFRAPNAINVNYNDYELWAEPVRYGITRVIVEVMSEKLNQNYGAVIFRNSKSDYRLSIDILRFNGDINSMAELDANWQVRSDNDILLSGTYQDKLVVGALVDDLILAQSQLIINLANHLASEINQGKL